MGATLQERRGSRAFPSALMIIFCTLTSQFDATLYAQPATTSLIVDHFVGSVGGVGTRDAPATEARLVRPGFIAGNSSYLFVYDDFAFTIRKVDRITGDVTTVLGQPFVDLGLDTVHSLWADENYLYIAIRNAISRLTISTGDIITLAGSRTVSDSIDGTGEAARFRGPYGLWGDGQQFLYVLDIGTYTSPFMGPFSPPSPLTPAAIRQISLQTLQVVTIPIPAVVPDATIQPPPTSIAGKGGVLYLGYSATNLGAAFASYEVATQTFHPLSGFPFSPSNNTFPPGNLPASFWQDGSGSLYFINNDNNGQTSVRRLSLTNFAISTLNLAIPGAVVPLTPAWIWGDGNTLYIADGLNTVVVQVDLGTVDLRIIAGLPSTALGSRWPRIATETHADATYPSDQFAPTVIWGDATSIYGILRNAVYRVSVPDGVITHLAGQVAQSGSSDGIGADALFNSPVALWGNGRYLYVAETGAVRRIDLTTRTVTHFANFTSFGLWGDGQFLYVAATNRIDRIDLSSGADQTFVPDLGVIQPRSLWGDGTSLFFVDDDAPDSAIYKVTIASLVLTRLAVFPNGGFSPGGIWGQNGLMFLATAQMIRSVDPATGAMQLITGDPRLYGTEDGVAAAARFVSAHSVWSDGSILYVADNGIRRIESAAGLMSFAVSAVGGDSWTANSNGPLTVTYGRVQPVAGYPVPEGVAIFSLRQNGVLISETAVPATSLTQSGRTYAQINGPVDTGVAIANPNDQPASISFSFTGANGQTVQTGNTIIPANGQIAVFMDQAPFNGPAGSGTFTFNSSLPVGAIALRGLVNERSEFLMTTLPFASLDSVSATAVVLPHFAVGGGWSTRILMVNPANTTITGSVHVRNPAGAESSVITYSIPGSASAALDVPNAGAIAQAGSLLIQPDSGNPAPVASTVFSFVRNGVTVTENGVAQTGAGHAFQLFVEASGNFGAPGSIRTGIAIANAGAKDGVVNLQLSNMSGVDLGLNTSITIPANGQTALFLNEIPAFSNLPVKFQGVLRLSTASPAGISMIGLRGAYNERGDFLIATMPCVNEELSDNDTEKVFPHIVNGGGYTTEFILMSPTATSGEVRFRSQSGSPTLP